jgi:hypothetical protein
MESWISSKDQEVLSFHLIVYADDILVFCRGKLSCIHALKNLFTTYASCSGQVINVSKSTIYFGGISQISLDNIVNLIGFNIGSLPFNYLGVPLKANQKLGIFIQLQIGLNQNFQLGKLLSYSLQEGSN